MLYFLNCKRDEVFFDNLYISGSILRNKILNLVRFKEKKKYCFAFCKRYGNLSQVLFDSKFKMYQTPLRVSGKCEGIA